MKFASRGGYDNIMEDQRKILSHKFLRALARTTDEIMEIQIFFTVNDVCYNVNLMYLLFAIFFSILNSEF